MVNLIKNIVKSKENEIVSAKQYENKSGSINIVMGRVVCELLSTQYLGPRILVLEMDSNFAGHKTIKKGFSNHHLLYAFCRFTKDNVMTFYLLRAHCVIFARLSKSPKLITLYFVVILVML